MAMQFRVAVEIEGTGPDTFKIGFEFSDEEGSGIEFLLQSQRHGILVSVS